MAEFKRVEHATLSPTKCVTCGDHVGPFIDLEVTLPVYGHLYLCAANDSRPGCVRQIARRDDMVERDELRTAERYIDELHEQVKALGNRLKGDKLIKLEEVAKYLKVG